MLDPLEEAQSAFMKTNPTCTACGGKRFICYSLTKKLGAENKGVFACTSCTLMAKYKWGGPDGFHPV